MDQGHDEQDFIQYRLGRIHVHEVGEELPLEKRRT
jgi:hypothetical protein